MSKDNPLLADDALPAFSKIRPEHVEPAVETLLADYRSGIDAITAPGAPRDFASVMLSQERLDQRLSRAWAPVGHLHSVADNAPELVPFDQEQGRAVMSRNDAERRRQAKLRKWTADRSGALIGFLSVELELWFLSVELP